MEIGRIFDLSVPLKPGMPTWADSQEVKIEYVGSVARDGATSERLSMASHSGTHVDAPAHFVQDGTTVDQVPLSKLVGFGYCIRPEFKGTEIHRPDFEKVWSKEYDGNIILVNTGWDRKRDFSDEFQKQFPALSEDSIDFFREHRVKTIGIDALGIEPYSHTDFKVHQALLGAGIPFIEDMAGLHELEEGKKYLIAALPLKIHNGSGGMARAIAMEITGE